MTDDDMPSAPLSRDAAYGTLLELIMLVDEPVLRQELIHAAVDYGHAAATEALHSVRELINARS
jgi:hypothetical protein